MASSDSLTTIEWFGVTTFRLCTKGITIFLDTWLERPSGLPRYLSVDEAGPVDYILISHAHFDHMPGADRLAIRTGATVIANCEVINLLRGAGVPEVQLVAVQGGERLPLFTNDVRNKANSREVALRPGPPVAPPLADPSLASMWLQVWPSLHCLMTSHDRIPPEMDTGHIYSGDIRPWVCTFDINRGMKHGLLKVDEFIARDKMDPGTRSFVDYVRDTRKNVYSAHDGGQLMYNLLIDNKSILWNGHLGAYDGILRCLDPQPDLAILGIAGVGNLNGKSFGGSAADFVLEEIRLLGEPRQVIWCMYDENLIAPYRIKTEAATSIVESSTKSKVLTLQPGEKTEIVL